MQRFDQAPPVQRLAALDIGTVTCRVLIADVGEGLFEELERRVAITNLGIGVDTTHRLKSDAITRVVNQVAEYVALIRTYENKQHPVIPIKAVATSAARDAENTGELIEQLRHLGVELSVIEGQQEAALSFRGASRGYEGQHLLIADIGGGSTELVLGVGGTMPACAHSFNIGCRRMTERFLVQDPPEKDACDNLRTYIKQEMAPWFAQSQVRGHVIERIVAVAGTPTSVVAIDQHMKVYDSSRVHGTEVSRDTLQRVYDELRSMPLVQRKTVVGLEPARASVIVAGLGILLEVLDLAQCDSFTVSESDILQGVLLAERE